jgi:hypothetical protein
MTSENKEAANTEAAAENLLFLFEGHVNIGEETQEVTDQGLFEMSAFFGTVPPEQRGNVFLTFLTRLHDKGYHYSMQQFLNVDDMEGADEDAPS